MSPKITPWKENRRTLIAVQPTTDPYPQQLKLRSPLPETEAGAAIGIPTHAAVSRGRPLPLGVTLDETGANVAVWAPDATAVDFCSFDTQDEEERISLPFNEGGIWFAHIAGVSAGCRYGFRAAGPYQPEQGQRFTQQKLLLDPYVRAIEAPLRWDPLMAAQQTNDAGELVEDLRDSAPVVPKGLVTAAPVGPDPTLNRPGHAKEDLVIYEAHVKGLTAQHPDVPESLRGTYLGMAHPVIINHLQQLGVTAVELLPVQAFIDDQFLVERGLTNYWGYQPISWCAPEPRYAIADAEAELRQLVHTLHEAGIEVIIDVVYNHTGEGNEQGPTLSLRGLHNTGYYRLLEDQQHYVNDSGTGNTVASEQPMTLRLVLDSLRHWVNQFGVDGFRFDLATALGRDHEGFKPTAAFFQAVQQDPVLSQVKLIAEPWDIGPGGYQLGHFPHPWSEWNDRFRDGVRKAWRGDLDGKTDIGSRLLGSAGQFDHSSRASTASINFLTAHDGFTLADVVSYNEKHNEANGEGGQDGHHDTTTDNMGVEGPTENPEILHARRRRVRAMLATLFVSQGVPMMLAGDELGNSQSGNNNAYVQDGPIGWINWDQHDAELPGFVARLSKLRRALPVLRQRAYLHSALRADGHPDVCWQRPDGATMTHEDWHDPDQGTIAVHLRGAAGDPTGEQLADEVFVVLNFGSGTNVLLPEGNWTIEIDTAELEAAGAVSGHYGTSAQSVLVLSRTPREN